MIKVANAALAVLAGVGGALLFYVLVNAIVERLPDRLEARLKPFVFVGPALAVVAIFLLYPAAQTIVFSFANNRSTAWVGFENYSALLGDPSFRQSLVNNLLWIILVPTISVAIGLVVAVLADRLGSRGEKVTKSIIFMPMAISFVGAATIWQFIYAWRPEGTGQIGILNAIRDVFGDGPITWLQQSQFNFNDMLLMIIMIWLQAGFAMVLLSAGIKNVPEDTLEAARIDGAGELAIFFRIVVPQIWPTVLVVLTTITILVMKIFDVVYATTGGNYGTDVIANRFFREQFVNGNAGRAAAVVVILIIAVIPVMIFQVRQFRRQEAGR